MMRFIISFVCMALVSVSVQATPAELVEISTNYGPIVVELNAKAAPRTVANFLSYVDEGFYDETIFHRVIDGFMIQGGGFDVDMVKKPTKKPILNESNNGLSNIVGTIAMARTNDPNSATSQFYINVANNTFLNYQSRQQPGYCVFGRVIEGIPIVQQIKAVPVSNRSMYQNVPDDPVIIQRIRRVTADELNASRAGDVVAPDPLLPNMTQ